MVLNVEENGPNDVSNTNTKLPDLNRQKIAKKWRNDPKMAKNGPNNGHFFHLGTHITF